MQILSLKMVLLFTGIACYSSLSTIHITTIDGQDKSMQDFSGKKILVVVLPVTQNHSDSIFLRSLDSLSVNFPNLAIIATPAFDDGYSPANSERLNDFYRGLLGRGIIVTKGMYTRKGAAQNQHELFSWLTHSEKNTHFNQDIEGPGQKCLINAQGELYAVIGPEMALWNRRMQSLIQQ